MYSFHVHSTFCDGKNTPEEIILAALEKGFSSIGFSGHSYMKYSPLFASKGDKTEEYKKEILYLKNA